ncbi:hypothetical protein BC936DRAFT_142622 [Jimgerdemannia flammicorona]|uniref:6-phosphofructo-2-kinase domain-containing protein n=1 Tax=Jimgerdemannia flammicorona TaxID=994334 RepID=A0A433A070_9FUNG|nr:hypothetical protein BC936DRAFT_142622 [Jimgerdemannia flammicorona]
MPVDKTMAAQLYKTTTGRLFHAGAIAIITVGLPARGKTHVSRSLCRYLRWLGVQTKVFSVGNYRRQRIGTRSNDFFAPGNLNTAAQRQEIAEECLRDMIDWLENGGGQVGIYDASNTTEERRRLLQELLTQNHIQAVFIGPYRRPRALLRNHHRPEAQLRQDDECGRTDYRQQR